MNAITDIWRQLVRRRLWPVAILLAGALVAVPVVLAKQPDPPVPAPPVAPVEGEDGALATEPIVALVGEPKAGASRRPLGNRHDIFKPTKKAVKAKAAENDPSEDGGTQPSGGGSEDQGGSGSGPGGGATPSPPADEPAKPKTYPLYSLLVRFSVGDSAAKDYVPRGSALPSTGEPLLIYLGLDDDHKTAVFMLDATVQAIGDGKCDPAPENCETVRMEVGDTMFFDVVDAEGNVSGEQFQLDLLKINKKQTADAAKAAKSARLATVASISSLRRSVMSGLGG